MRGPNIDPLVSRLRASAAARRSASTSRRRARPLRALRRRRQRLVQHRDARRRDRAAALPLPHLRWQTWRRLHPLVGGRRASRTATSAASALANLFFRSRADPTLRALPLLRRQGGRHDVARRRRAARSRSASCGATRSRRSSCARARPRRCVAASCATAAATGSTPARTRAASCDGLHHRRPRPLGRAHPVGRRAHLARLRHPREPRLRHRRRARRARHASRLHNRRPRQGGLRGARRGDPRSALPHRRRLRRRDRVRRRAARAASKTARSARAGAAGGGRRERVRPRCSYVHGRGFARRAVGRPTAAASPSRSATFAARRSPAPACAAGRRTLRTVAACAAGASASIRSTRGTYHGTVRGGDRDRGGGMKPRALLLLMMLLLLPLYAAARPGGGQSYHAAPSHSSSSSSSHSYSSSSHSVSSGGGGGSMSPGDGADAAHRGRHHRRHRDGGQEARRRSRRRSRSIAATQTRGWRRCAGQDPAFDGAAFAERAKGVMAKVNEAWVAGAMGPARRHISDGVYVRFQTQLALLEVAGAAQRHGRLVGGGVRAARRRERRQVGHRARQDGRPGARRRRAGEPERAAGGREGQAAPLVRYEEVWSFLRRAAASPRTGCRRSRGTAPTAAPTCRSSDVVRCEYCKAVVNSGEHDWVLAEITSPRSGARG